MSLDLFADAGADPPEPWHEPLAPGAAVLHGFALPHAAGLLERVREVIAQAPPRRMVTPGGLRMSVAMTNCGPLGWVSDSKGYRYDSVDPQVGLHWPAMPALFATLAANAAASVGFQDFVPDACLLNFYEPGARLSPHQDKDERDFSAPIVSVSLGLPAVFLFGGLSRSDKSLRIPLTHGDVVVWGGPARLRYHGVLSLKPGHAPGLGEQRINLTFRKAG